MERAARSNGLLLALLAGAIALLAFAATWQEAAPAIADEEAPEGLIFPFVEGETWRITCGYADGNGCQHNDSDWTRYSLDFQHVSGGQATKGRSIIAVAEGTVAIAGWGGESSYGWYVEVDHGEGIRSVYAHMQQEPFVDVGQDVKQGDVLGPAGCTGHCTGPHIHFAMLKNGVAMVPEPLCGEDGFNDGQTHVGCGEINEPPPLVAAGPGDASCDGSTDSLDAAVVLQFDAGMLDELKCFGSADVDWDGVANARDALLILQFSAGLLETLYQGTWSAGPPMLAARTEVTSAVIDGVIYVIGGFSANGQNTNTVQAYDTSTETWTTRLPYPHALDHAMAASVGGELYVMGGYVNFGGRVFSPLVNRFDPEANAWEALPDMPRPRAAGAATVIDGIIYVFGGVGPDAEDAFAYDPATNEWEVIASIALEREHLTAAAVDGEAFVIGGRENVFDNLSMVEGYDPDANAFDVRASLPTARGGLASAVLNGAIHVIGGEDLLPGGTTFEEHEVYRPGGDYWAPAPPLPTARHGLTAQVVDGKLYVIGGGPTPNLSVSNVLEIYTPPAGAIAVPPPLPIALP